MIRVVDALDAHCQTFGLGHFVAAAAETGVVEWDNIGFGEVSWKGPQCDFVVAAQCSDGECVNTDSLACDEVRRREELEEWRRAGQLAGPDVRRLDWM